MAEKEKKWEKWNSIIGINFKLIAFLLIFFGVIIWIINLYLVKKITSSNILLVYQPFKTQPSFIIENLSIISIMMLLLFLLIPPLFMHILNSKFTAFIFSILFGWFLLCLWGYYNVTLGLLYNNIPPLFMLFGESIASVIYSAPWFAVFSALKKEKITYTDSSPFQLAGEVKNQTYKIALISLILSVLSFLTGPLWFVLILFGFIGDIRFANGVDLIQRKIMTFLNGSTAFTVRGSVLLYGMLSILICSPFFILAIIGGHLVRRECRQNPEIKGFKMAKAALIIGYVSGVLSILFYLLYYGLANMQLRH